ncbi:TetR/AcrR family transcriptional regulator [Roseovarius phycicola]|uniref:TetR/AcrR family transcriptional regulator n=1 Tax=Roseovarius phycicola TaxID=3080976 RepID=A0ABZ2HN02_9RHOB
MLDNDTTDRNSRLTRDDWIEAAQTMLIDSGVEAVQITVLARALSVTRGSFYWHFDNREALLDALIHRWRTRNTNVMVDTVSDAETLDDGILALFAVWTDHRRFDPDLDQAIRDWARYDDALREKVKAEDAARVQAVSAFFERFGYPQPEAFIRARVICFTQITYYALDVANDETLEERLGYLEAYFRSFTGRDIQPDTVAAYRNILAREEPVT